MQSKTYADFLAEWGGDSLASDALRDQVALVAGATGAGVDIGDLLPCGELGVLPDRKILRVLGAGRPRVGVVTQQSSSGQDFLHVLGIGRESGVLASRYGAVATKVQLGKGLGQGALGGECCSGGHGVEMSQRVQSTKPHWFTSIRQRGANDLLYKDRAPTLMCGECPLTRPLCSGRLS